MENGNEWNELTEAVGPTVKTTMRMMQDVLTEPGKNVRPLKRRRGKGRRRIDPKDQGKINQFFTKLQYPKECTPEREKMTEGGAVRRGNGMG